MVSGDILYITDSEHEKVMEVLRLHNEQIEKLIKNTDRIIGELTTLNGTVTSIDSNTTATKTNTANIYSQIKSNGTLLSQIKSVCDSIYSWVRSHYAYSN